MKSQGQRKRERDCFSCLQSVRQKMHAPCLQSACFDRQTNAHSLSFLPIATGQSPLGAAHTGAIVGVAVDSCNRLMVSVGLDRALRIWDFKTMKVCGCVCVVCASVLCVQEVRAGSV